MAATSDPYKILGLSPDASDEHLRATYRRLVQANHPDHNQGSPDSARRFEEIQEAYSRIRELRVSRPGAGQTPPPAGAPDPDLESRLADIERQVREAQAAREKTRAAQEKALRAREQAQRAAAEATSADGKRPSDEELGYVRTDDSFAQILADAEAELTERLAGARDHPAGRRLGEVIDDLAAKLKGEGT